MNVHHVQIYLLLLQLHQDLLLQVKLFNAQDLLFKMVLEMYFNFNSFVQLDIKQIVVKVDFLKAVCLVKD